MAQEISNHYIRNNSWSKLMRHANKYNITIDNYSIQSLDDIKTTLVNRQNELDEELTKVFIDLEDHQLELQVERSELRNLIYFHNSYESMMKFEKKTRHVTQIYLKYVDPTEFFIPSGLSKDASKKVSIKPCNIKYYLRVPKNSNINFQRVFDRIWNEMRMYYGCNECEVLLDWIFANITDICVGCDKSK